MYFADLNSSAPRKKRLPVGRESQASSVVVRGIQVEVAPDDEHLEDMWCPGTRIC